MATIRERTLKNGKISFEIQVKSTDKNTGKQVIKSMTWRPDEGMTAKKAQKEVILVADRFEKEILQTLSGFSAGYDPTSITFREAGELWLEKVKKDNAPTYYVKVKDHLEYINENIGGYKLKEITPGLLQNFFNAIDKRRKLVRTITPVPNFKDIIQSYGYDYMDLRYKYKVQPATLCYAMQGKNVGEKWANNFVKITGIPYDKLFIDVTEEKEYAWETNSQIKRTVRVVLSFAKKKRLVDENYAKAEYIDYPKRPKRKIKIMDDQTAQKFFDFVAVYPDMRIRTAMLILILTGFRRAEVCGLEWSDIDFDKKTISVNKTIIYLPEYGVFESGTKTEESTRIVAASDFLMTALKDYYKYWLNVRQQCGDYMQPSNKLFTNQRGGLINPNQIEAWMKRVIKESETAYYTPHSLRHTNISLQIAMGVPITTISGRAGHSRVSTTTDIYGHLFQSTDRLAADKLNTLFTDKNEDVSDEDD